MVGPGKELTASLDLSDREYFPLNILDSGPGVQSGGSGLNIDKCTEVPSEP